LLSFYFISAVFGNAREQASLASGSVYPSTGAPPSGKRGEKKKRRTSATASGRPAAVRARAKEIEGWRVRRGKRKEKKREEGEKKERGGECWTGNVLSIS